MRYMYIPTEIKRELVRFGVNYNQKGLIVGIFRGTVAVLSNGVTIFSFTYIGGITHTGYR